MMQEDKKAKLEAAGWKVGTVDQFLDLSPEESEYIELRLRLGDAVKQLRQKAQLTQVQLAERMGSSQSRVAKAEASDDSVSLDLLVRSLLALGASKKDLARYISG